MKKIITLLSLMLCLFATAQEKTDTMYIYQNDNVVKRIPVSQIDSVIFVAPKVPQVPETPTVTYEAIDLGLPSGVKWATCNVGATVPEDYGEYYAWGEIEEKDDYSWSTYRWCNGTYNSMTKYCTSASNGTVDNKTVLEPEDDVAHVKWGGSWRMPTNAEQDELRNNCTWTWKTLNGVNGYEVTGPNGNSIFLPAAGYRNGTEVSYRGNYGNYWSGSLYSNYSNYAYNLYFLDSNYYWDYSNRYYGQSVRPVCDTGTETPTVNYTVTVSTFDANGTVSIEGIDDTSITLTENETVTVTATPANGYKFVGWYVEGTDTPISTDAVYTFTVSANVALVAKFEAEESGDSGSLNGHDYVDLGLPSGLKWATCNVGASSPEEYGGYYAWGEIEEKADYGWNTYRWCNGTSDSMTKYCSNDSYGTVDNKSLLDPEDDVAHVKWGGNWRMPTRAEQDELRNNCTWTWTTLNGVNGYQVTGPNGNSIFLPAAGYRNDTEVDYRGDYGYYWSSSLDSDYSSLAYGLYFLDSSYDWSNYRRFYGRSVRPVCDSTINPAENYSVSVSTNGNGEVLIEGTQENSVTVSAGASVTVVATPADGYKFIGWYIGESDTPVSTDATYTFAVSANVVLVAKFESFVEFVDGHGCVDLALPSGLKWATCNVGATSPEESGVYRIWSATTYDWGNNWRMPTQAELEELINNCTWSWIMQNGVNGVEFTGNNGNRIFLPAAGFKDGSLQCFNEQGCYWSSTYYNSLNSYPLLFNHNGCTTKEYFNRETGINIRLVLSDN